MRVLSSELLKIWTAPRTVLGMVLAELAIVAIGTASTIDSATSSELSRPASLEQDLIGVAASSMLFALLLGVLIITWEYRHGTLTQTFLLTPVREWVIAAKTVVAALAGATLAVPALLLMLVITEIWIPDRVDFGSHELELVARLFLSAAIVAVLGLEIGASTGRQLGAIVVIFAWLIFAEPALSTWNAVQDYLPLRAIDGVLGMGGEGSLSFGRGLVTIACYVAGLGALAVAITRRRDIT